MNPLLGRAAVDFQCCAHVQADVAFGHAYGSPILQINNIGERRALTVRLDGSILALALYSMEVNIGPCDKWRSGRRCHSLEASFLAAGYDCGMSGKWYGRNAHGLYHAGVCHRR